MEGLYHIPLAFYEVGGKLYVMLGAELVHACLAQLRAHLVVRRL